jgi:hypothetical protein
MMMTTKMIDGDGKNYDNDNDDNLTSSDKQR